MEEQPNYEKDWQVAFDMDHEAKNDLGVSEGLTIFDISEMTGLKLQSVSGRPSELIKKGLIFEYATVVGGSHNKATVYKHIKWKDYLTNPY